MYSLKVELILIILIIIYLKSRLAWLDVFAPNKTRFVIDKKHLRKRLRVLNSLPAPQFLQQVQTVQVSPTHQQIQHVSFAHRKKRKAKKSSKLKPNSALFLKNTSMRRLLLLLKSILLLLFKLKWPVKISKELKTKNLINRNKTC